MLDVSIIIVNWNTRDLLRKCLQHVESTVKESQYETIMIDNHSEDGSQAMVRQEFPDVQLIENRENVGFARANNQGIAISQGRYVLLLNSDAFVQEKTIDTMVEFMDAHPEAGISACKLLYEDGKLQPSCYPFPSLKAEFYTAVQLDKLFSHSREFGKAKMTWWGFDEMRSVDAVMGAFMLVRASAIAQVGMLDESYFMYSEEVDWCYRFKKMGWKILFMPDVECIHIWWGSGRKTRTRLHLQMYRSKVHFFRKHYGVLSAVILKFLIGLNCFVRLGPGAIYYLWADREKYQANWKLLQALPSF